MERTYRQRRIQDHSRDQRISAQPVNSAPRSRAPIGVFDSGVGGLSVLRALRAQLPHEDF